MLYALLSLSQVFIATWAAPRVQITPEIKLLDQKKQIYSAVQEIPPTFTRHNAIVYLRNFGYLLDPNKGKEKQPEGKEEFEDAIMAFQRFSGLEQTGILDEPTIEKMLAPRCGVSDLVQPEDEHRNPLDVEIQDRKRQKRYAIEGSYWGVKDITYRVSKYTQEMDKGKVDNVIDRAFKVWEESSTLRFTRVEDGPVNVEIMFANRSHGDGEPFDGRGQILAHAFFPRYGGDVHFDEEEPWRALQAKDNCADSDMVILRGYPTMVVRAERDNGAIIKYVPVRCNINGHKSIDLYSVAAHEIGHSLGLKHSQNHQALMAPFYQGYTGDAIHLKADDLKGLQHLYGKPKGRTDASTPGPPPKHKNNKYGKYPELKPTVAETNPPSADNDICDNPKIDAITVLGNGSTYAFKGEFYWKLNQLSYEEGYPKVIADHWDGLPGSIDAAVTDYDGDTYFFKGDEYWLYNPDGKRYKGYPRKIEVGLVDTPTHIDAAMIWSYDDKPYFFKGREFWQYSRWGMPSSWPRFVTDIFGKSPDIPTKIDAALKWTNGKTYLFSGNQYYRLTGWRVMKVIAGYPRETGEWWFGCPSRKSRQKRTPKDYSQK